MTCPNCHLPLGCSCQKRTASNGYEACVNCLPQLEATIAEAEKAQRTVAANPAPAR